MEVLSEDWNEDFVFEARPDDDDDGFDFGDAFTEGAGDRRGGCHGAVSLPERGRYVIVPQAIKERQANVHGDLGQVKDFALLVEELKRLRIVAQARGMVEGPSAELWSEADDIIDLASSNHDHHHHDYHDGNNGGYAGHSSMPTLPPPQSPSSPGWGWGLDPFEEEPSPVALAAAAAGPWRKRRKSVLSLDEEFYSSPGTMGASNGTSHQQQSRDRPPDEGDGSGNSSGNDMSSNGNTTNSSAYTINSGSNGSNSNGTYSSNGSSTPTTTTTSHHRSSPSLSRMPSRSSRHESSPSVARTVIETIHQRRTGVSSLAENNSPSTPTAPPPPPPKKMPFDSTTLRELVAHVRLLSRRLAELVRGAEKESPMMTTTTMMNTMDIRNSGQTPSPSPMTTTTTMMNTMDIRNSGQSQTSSPMATTTTTMNTWDIRGQSRSQSPVATATVTTSPTMNTVDRGRSQSHSPHLSPKPSFGQVLAGSVTTSPSSFGNGGNRPAKKSRSATDVMASPPPSTMTTATGKENEMEMEMGGGGGPILMAVI
ncbi:MAG: hypothetical protein M1823_003070 [Watsoniomyces obsoletus]|nr:MAG: hypothetical protein M1823_003070 [Watsoniomyces obsoletus]